MVLRVCIQRVFRWTCRITPEPFFFRCTRAVSFEKRNGSLSVFMLRRICSKSDGVLQEIDSRLQKPLRRPVREEVLPALVQLGFSEDQAELLLNGACNNRAGQTVALHLCGISHLVSLGLKSSSILKVLEKCPKLYRVKGTQMQQRIDNLRKLGLVEGSLQRVISQCPTLLTLPPKRLNLVCRCLQEKCLFTSQQVTEILRDFPSTMLEDAAQLEYKFQYAYFRMGLRQAEMVRSGLFRVSLEDLSCRHSFLERRGQYQTPDKKGQTRIANPSLKDVICPSEDTFLSRVAQATQEEFEVFRKLLVREQEEAEEEDEEELQLISEEEDSEAEDEDVEGHGSEKRRSTNHRRRGK
ncbi:transcription termination factor 4, mitochondrial [Paramormyrops kingsleyae]|uniref:transcription termination factor 4, mitochondrial n=1 Tax=Paramormyrops kingsleyae TaxID=1676925 RepID=UPI003B96D276